MMSVPDDEVIEEEIACEECCVEEGDSVRCGCDCVEVMKWQREQEEYEVVE